MRKLNFKYIAAWNFLCFGEEGIELDFSNLGNIVLVRGMNLDVKPVGAEGTLFADADEEEQERLSSNGTGKSSIQEIMCWGLFGKTVKNNSKIKIDTVINNIVGEKCKVEVRWDEFRVVRERPKKAKGLCSFYEWNEEKNDWDDLTQGTMDATQKTIDDKLGLSYEAFLNICIFADDQRMCFLESDGTTKRHIVETLMSLVKYQEWQAEGKDFLTEVKKTIKNLTSEYELLLGQYESAKHRLQRASDQEAAWKKAQLTELRNFKQQIESKKKKLEESDSGAELLLYQDAQERIREINELLPKREADQKKRDELLVEAETRFEGLKAKARTATTDADELAGRIRDNRKKSKEAQQNIDELQEDGATCITCFGTVEKENAEHVIKKAQNIIQACGVEIDRDTKASSVLAEKITKIVEAQQKIRDIVDVQKEKHRAISSEIGSLSRELSTLSQVREPKADSDALLLEQEIATLKSQALTKKTEYEGPSPYKDIMTDAEKESVESKKVCDGKKKEIENAQAEIPYYEYWLQGFGPEGIRKWVIDGIIPALNSKIAYWLQFLIDNKISLKFNNMLVETIERNPPDGDAFVYHAMSTGERRRLNLAVSQAFAHVMSISTGTNPSIVFLDEVSTNIDPLGVQGIYNMICELAEEKQVFITTHDHDLLKLLETAHVIRLQRKNGITRMLPDKS